MTGLALALAASCLIALSMGRYSVNPADVLRVLRETLTGSPPLDEGMQTVLFAIRVPRAVAAMFVGAALSLSGAVYQGVFKNPLVSPTSEYRRARVSARTAISRRRHGDADFGVRLRMQSAWANITRMLRADKHGTGSRGLSPEGWCACSRNLKYG